MIKIHACPILYIIFTILKIRESLNNLIRISVYISNTSTVYGIIRIGNVTYLDI